MIPSPNLSRPDDVPRRGFLVRLLAAVVSLVVVVIPSTIAGIFLANPLSHRRRSSTNDLTDFVPLAINPKAVPDDGTPVLATIVADRTDAWNRHPSQRVGAIWVRKTASTEIVALSTICPHLGCRVDYRPLNHDYYCPCHTSKFTLDGEPTNKIPPRSMDPIEIKVGDDGRLWARYIEFRGGIAERIPV